MRLDSCRTVMVTMKCFYTGLVRIHYSVDEPMVMINVVCKVRGAEEQIICSDQCMQDPRTEQENKSDKPGGNLGCRPPVHFARGANGPPSSSSVRPAGMTP